MIPGRASVEGTKRFSRRSPSAEGHFRRLEKIRISSIGLGTYLGEEDGETDAGYEASIVVALESGVNVFDSAINYRGQKSERAIGRALAREIAAGRLEREEVFVSTKGGYLPHDSDDPRDPKLYILETFVRSGLAPRDEIAEGGNCIAPGYLLDQIQRSRANLDLETIDLYYLHNIESQRTAADAETFRNRLRRAAEALEKAASDGWIVRWGLATWDGLRAPPEHPEHLSIAETLKIAREVGGEKHHFAAVQMPVNLGMAQAIAYPSQETDAGRVPALTAAHSLGIAAFGSASLMQGRLAVELPEEVGEAFPEARSPAQRAIQFTRSALGMTTSLVGVSDPAHARDSFGLAACAPALPERVMGLFS